MTRPAVRETGHLDSAHPPAPCGLRAFCATVLILILILIVIPYGVDELSGGTTRLSLGPVLVMCVCVSSARLSSASLRYLSRKVTMNQKKALSEESA